MKIDTMHDIDLNASPMATNDEDSYEDCMRQPLDSMFSNSISESSMIVKEPNSNVNASLSEEVLQKKNVNDQDTMRYLDLNAPPLPIGDGNSCEDYMRNPLDMKLCETMGESDIMVNEHCFLNASQSKEVLQKKHANDEDTMRYLDLNAPPLPIGDGNSCEDYMRKPLDMMLGETMGGSSMMVNEHCFLNASRLKEVLQKNTNDEDVIPRFDLNVSHLFDNDDTLFEGRDYHVQQSSTLMHNLNTVSYKTTDILTRLVLPPHAILLMVHLLLVVLLMIHLVHVVLLVRLVCMVHHLYHKGILFDTCGEYYEDLRDFHQHLSKLLKPGGIYSRPLWRLSYFFACCYQKRKLILAKV